MTSAIKKRIEKGLVWGSLIITALTASNSAKDLGDVYYVWLLPVLIFTVLTFFKRFEIFNIFRHMKKRDVIVSGILTAAYLIMSPITEVFRLSCFTFSGKSFFQSFLVPFNYLFFLLAAAELFGCIIFGFNATNKEAFSPECSKKKSPFLVCTIIIAGVSVAYAFAGYPGILHEDGIGIWNSASDWHPIGYVAIVRFCFLIWKNPFSIVIFQTVLWILTNILLLDALKKYKSPNACITYTILSLTAGIMAYKYLPVVYKDVVFSICFLGFAVSLYRLLRKLSVSNFIFLALYAVFASVTRHGAVVPVILTLACTIIVYLIQHNPKIAVKIAACCAIPVVVVSGALKLTVKFSKISENPSYVTYTVPLFMLGAYAASGLEMSEETITTMEKIMPLSDWKKGYQSDPYWADTVSRNWGIVGNRIDEFEKQSLQGAVIKANWDFFSNHPKDYLKYFFDINSLVWEMSRPDGTYAEWLVNSFDNCSDRAEETYPQWYPADHNVFRKILEPVTSVAFDVPVWRIVSYRGGISIWMIAYASFVIGKKDKQTLLIALPFFIYAGMLMLSLPAQDPRFILPFVEFAVFYFSIAFIPDKRENSDISLQTNAITKEEING